MRKSKLCKIRVFVFLVLSACGNILPFESIPDSNRTLNEFRSIPWGSSMKEVREKEEAHYLQNFSGFGITATSFKDKIAGIEARIDYTFRDNKLIEGSYIIDPKGSYKTRFVELLKFVAQKYGQPEYRSGSLYTDESVWVKENDFGKFSGPSFYWGFNDGFISLHSQKFEDEITITVLFAHGVSIEKYAKNIGVELNKFPYKVIEE